MESAIIYGWENNLIRKIISSCPIVFYEGVIAFKAEIISSAMDNDERINYVVLKNFWFFYDIRYNNPLFALNHYSTLEFSI